MQQPGKQLRGALAVCRPALESAAGRKKEQAALAEKSKRRMQLFCLPCGQQKPAARIDAECTPSRTP
ncbi:hypothetical protein GUJ93_ZPchr0004g38101 [Zizania palustris]|nr:hypothetical protein GUJ93_ZPchr0004g38101 [Zizania palustris]